MDEDFELLKRWAAGKQTAEGKQAGDALFRRYFETLHRYFINKAHEADVVELIQNTMMACLESSGSFRGDSKFRAWLFGIARNTLLHHYRYKYRKGDKIDPLCDSTAELAGAQGMSSALAKRREQAFVLAALRAIPTQFQEVLELRYWEGVSDPECAEILGVSLAAVKGRVRRAKQQFRAALEKLLAEGRVPQGERDSITKAMAGWIAGVQREIRAGSGEERELEEDWNSEEADEEDGG